MSYTYNADGVKLKSVPLQFGGPAMNPFGLTGPTGAQPQGNPIPGGDGGGMPGELTLDTSTLYCGNVIFERGELSKLLTDEGYVTFTNDSTPVYYYYLRDHLGNVRVVFTGGFLGDIEQRNDYYPSGALMATSTGGSVQPYKYNGKELDRMNGLDWYDYGARHMDVALGRFTTMDPLCEKYYGVSPYAYCGGNPVNCIDPDGRDVVLHGDSINKSNSIEQIQKGVGEGIIINYSDNDSHLSYQICDGYDASLLSKEAKLFMKIIDNHNVVVNINATSCNELDDDKWFYGGAYLGNEIMENGTVMAYQTINPQQLATMDEYGAPGQNIFHELSESYVGALLRLQNVAPSEIYSLAHDAATPQAELSGGNFNLLGNYSKNRTPLSNSYKIFVSTQQGIKVLYNRDLLIKNNRNFLTK